MRTKPLRPCPAERRHHRPADRRRQLQPRQDLLLAASASSTPCARGDLLRARCRGSSGGPYLVEATLAPADKPKSRNPVTYLCNCPRGGFCKHVVALLLTWSTDRNRLTCARRLPTSWRQEPGGIGRSDRDDAGRGPQSRTAHRAASRRPRSRRTLPVDEAAIRRLIGNAFPDSCYEEYEVLWYGRLTASRTATTTTDTIDFSFATHELERVVGYADAYVEGGHWRNAMLVSAVLVEQLAVESSTSIRTKKANSTTSPPHRCQSRRLPRSARRLPAEERFTDEERGRLIDASWRSGKRTSMPAVWTILDGGAGDDRRPRHTGRTGASAGAPAGDDAAGGGRCLERSVAATGR